MTRLGKYRLIAELGRGGMANVFLAVTENATGINFNKLVVVKRLREHIADDPEFVTMLMDEGRIAARLNHPNVVQTIEVDSVDGELFLTMEYLDGQALHRILARHRASFPLNMHLAVLVDVLNGIHHAHDLADFDGTPLNVVHRDVTPHNVFVTYSGQVKVVDFGIAKAEGRAAETKAGIVKGKVAYMAPEQARSDLVDRRTDVFAVGIMLFEACIGRRMWDGKKDVDVLRALIHGQYLRSPREIDPTVPEELDAICRRALAPNISDRYGSADDFARDLESFMRAKAPRPSSRELGAWVAERFNDKRELTKRVIESQLTDLKDSARTQSVEVVAIPAAAPSAAALPAREPRAKTSSPARPASRAEGDFYDDAAAKDPPTTLMTSPPAPLGATLVSNAPGRRTSTARLAMFAVLAGAAVVVMIIAMVSRLSPGADATARTAPNGEAAAPATEMTITLRATPLEARFTIDDGPLFDNPYIARVKRDHIEHVIRASAPGFEPKSQVVKFEDDVSIRFVLSRAADAQP